MKKLFTLFTAILLQWHCYAQAPSRDGGRVAIDGGISILSGARAACISEIIS